jgi:hypothetical protein
MPARTTILRTAAAVSLAVVPLVGVGLTSAAAAETAPPSASPGPQLTRACGKIPHRIERLERVQTRLHADARTKGSIAFLQARIDRAKAAGHEDLARVLGDRMTVRKSVDDRLPTVLTALRDAQEVCAAHTPKATS